MKLKEIIMEDLLEEKIINAVIEESRNSFYAFWTKEDLKEFEVEEE